MPDFTAYKLLDACREQGCPVCRLEQQGVQRYLDVKFYESVNNPAWRNRLRASLGFCREHAWLAVDRRLGDPLGFTIIYQDIVNSVLHHLNDQPPARASRRWKSLLRQVPERSQKLIEKMLYAFTPRQRCPVCEHKDELTGTVLSVLVDELETQQMSDALQASEGLCLLHLRLALEHVKKVAVCEKLLMVHREKLESLKTELAEFIRKNDYQFSAEGFGKEGDAWLRAVGMLTGGRKDM